MPSTNIKEIAIEELVVNFLVENNGFVQRFYNGDNTGAYNVRECIDVEMLFDFLEKSQPKQIEKLKEAYGEKYKTSFLSRLQKEIKEKGIITVFRKGVKDLNAHLYLMYFEPNSNLNPESLDLWKQNIFAVARQVHYSEQNNNSLDVLILINGLPIITLELKNLLTGQTVKNAMYQYQNDRNSKEELFRFEDV